MAGGDAASEFEAELAGRVRESHFAAVYDGNPASRSVLETEHFVTFVDFAPLTVGHLLVVPRQDLPSFTVLPEDGWQEWIELRGRLRELIAEHWLRPTLLEHGSTREMRGGACVSHAHIHLVPIGTDLLAAINADGLEMRAVADQRGVAQGQPERPYIYLETPEEECWHTWVDQHPIPSQYIRQLIARELGLAEPSWDWGTVVFKDLLRETVAVLGNERQ
jgi:diadenosine tetraphosphate (Ap4A) HIT family hydrolase